MKQKGIVLLFRDIRVIFNRTFLLRRIFMLIRFVWRQCYYELIPEALRKYGVDAFFIEAAFEEAEVSVFPSMDPESVSESKSLGLHCLWNGEKVLARSYCFLAARDLSYIFPVSPAFPFDHLGSPGVFEPLDPVVSVDSLRSIRFLSMSADDGEEMEEEDFYAHELDGESE
ncbi:MAG TPA: hypothetical protein PK008_09005 [Aminivibrio sp.]|nr:hypothetical protein [Aminivibrio sp.]MEA4953553.1 hypothetical protein [Aminivibrio sp.]HPF85556.1 hypothetical protein [Aminivibrio sp.]HRV98035.1 hypothetical protein [Aminobacteriaceae bacterium]